MSNDNHKPAWLSTPTEAEIEALLSDIKPRPTARLNQLMRSAPWRAEEEENKMVQLKRLNFIGIGAALIFLVLITAVVYTRWPNRETTAAAPIPSRPTAVVEATATAPPPAPIVRGHLFEVNASETMDNQEIDAFSALAYGGSGEDGRLYKTYGYQGIQVFDAATGKELAPISIVDPDTDQLVFVRDIAWGPLLWLGPPTEGLFVLTDPFENGKYLHLLNPENGEIVRSMEINNNIAIDNRQPLLGESVPNHLVMTDSGELYLDRVYTFAPEQEGDSPVAYHYILRTMLEGQILNSILVSQGPMDEAQPTVIEALAYQAETNQVFAAVRLETGPTVQKFSLINQPRMTGVFDGENFSWDQHVSMSSDNQGYVYVLTDNPRQIVVFDQDDQIVAVYGFGNGVADSDGSAVTDWLAFTAGRPVAITVSPDGSTLFVVNQNQGQMSLVAYPLGE